MYEKILVPLDGSKLAECALPHVMDLAGHGTAGEVILLNVVENPMVLFGDGVDFVSIENAQFSKAQKYLSDLQSHLCSQGVNAKIKVLEGNTADAIIKCCKEDAVSLIVIATHGYSGIKQLMLGSVAMQVLHDAHVPVLLVKPDPVLPGQKRQMDKSVTGSAA